MSTVVKWAPFSELDVFERRMRRMLEDFGVAPAPLQRSGAGAGPVRCPGSRSTRATRSGASAWCASSARFSGCTRWAVAAVRLSSLSGDLVALFFSRAHSPAISVRALADDAGPRSMSLCRGSGFEVMGCV
jgi:hypothetical protein